MREVLKRLESDARTSVSGMRTRKWLKKLKRGLKKYCRAVECQHGHECDICELGNAMKEIEEVLK